MLSLMKLRKFIWAILIFGVCIWASTDIVFAQAVDSVAEGDDTEQQATETDDGGGGEVPDQVTLDLGQKLYEQNCKSCHNLDENKLVGPGLKGILERQTIDWLIPWVKNSQAVIASGDPYAVKLYEEYDKAQMQSFNLKDDEIKAIFAYVDYAGDNPAAEEVTEGEDGEVNPAQPKDNEAFSNYLVLILGALLLVLALILAVLVMLISVLTKYLNQANLDEDSQEVLQQKIGFNVGKLFTNPYVIRGFVLLFILLITKFTLDGMVGIGIQQGYAPTQPIAFSHKLHAGEYEIECQYCHTGVNKGKSATIPSANICMNCHNVIKRSSPEIQKIYAAIENNEPIEWVRIHNLPDFAYFNHAQHVEVGQLDCANCHGEIQEMEVVQQRSPLTMGWCIDCHRQTVVKAEGNAYYDRLLAAHEKDMKGNTKPLVVEDIGGLECSKCHY